MKFDELLSRDGTRISYFSQGRGKPVVVLLGHQPASMAWATLAPIWPAHLQAVLPDLRGGGWSERPTYDGAYDPERLTDDLESVVRSLNRRADLLACGSAVPVALALARRAVATRILRWALLRAGDAGHSPLPTEALDLVREFLSQPASPAAPRFGERYSCPYDRQSILTT